MVKVIQSKEALVKVNGVELAYDIFGNPSDPPLLLVMGLGAQMIRWDEEFCKALAAQGFWVIRFDNRDVGNSTKFGDAGVPNILALMQAVQQGEAVSAPYTLSDMAGDAVGLLDALEIEKAHIVGASLGGMIVQTMAIEHPERVRSMTSIMSTTGDVSVSTPKPEALAVIMDVPPSNRAECIEDAVKKERILRGPKYPLDEEFVRQFAARAFDRCYYPEGMTRQLAAVLASGNRKEALKSVKVPTLVIHGDADPLLPVEGGKDTAASIPGAKLLIIEGMGHDIPVEVAPQVIAAITRHAK
ncbi:MAG: alpha/beta fold hydrolase [Promethearchaeota archaeon]